MDRRAGGANSAPPHVFHQGLPRVRQQRAPAEAGGPTPQSVASQGVPRSSMGAMGMSRAPVGGGGGEAGVRLCVAHQMATRGTRPPPCAHTPLRGTPPKRAQRYQGLHLGLQVGLQAQQAPNLGGPGVYDASAHKVRRVRVDFLQERRAKADNLGREGRNRSPWQGAGRGESPPRGKPTSLLRGPGHAPTLGTSIARPVPWPW